MARTAPFPNIAAIPGMNPGVFVMGGGTDSGGSGPGGGKGRGNGQGAGGGNGGNDASGGGKSADGNTPCGGGCGGPHPLASRGDPVDVLSGRVSTVPVVDFELPGPLPLTFRRCYDSGTRHRDTGFGHGWTNPLTWEIEVHRRHVLVWDEEGCPLRFPRPDSGAEVLGPRGWVLRYDGARYELTTPDELRRIFEEIEPGEHERERIAVLMRVRDRNDNAIRIERAGRLLRSLQDSAGRRIEAEVDSSGHVVSLVVVSDESSQPRRALVTWSYDAAGDLVSSTDPDGFAAGFTYDDGDHLLTTATDRAGVTSHYLYDSNARCVETWRDRAGGFDGSVAIPATLADGSTRPRGAHHYRFLYSGDGYSEVTGPRAVERFEGSPDGRIDKSVHGGAVVSRRYDEAGQLIGFEDGRGAATLLERDTGGRWIRRAAPGGEVSSVTRDAAGRIVEEVSPDGGVTRIRRDERGNPIEVIEPDGAATTHTYDAQGRMLAWTDADGATSTANYDAFGNWVTVTLPGGARRRRTFDHLGRKTSETDPDGGVTHFRWSARGDLLERHDEIGGVTRFTYDGERRLTSETTPEGHTTRYTYGLTGKLHTLTGPLGGVFEVRTTLDGAIAHVENENRELHAQAWDARGNLIEERTFDGREIRYSYDLADRLTAARYASSGVIATLCHDDAGRLVRRELADGEVEIYEYDAAGRVTRATNRDTVCRFTWSASGRLVREEQELLRDADADPIFVELDYSPAGLPVRRCSSLGHRESLSWSPRGHLTSRQVNGATVFEAVHDKQGLERLRTLPGRGRILCAHDQAGRWTGTQVIAGESIEVEIHRRLGPDGAPELGWDSRAGGLRYEHDAAGRCVGVVRADGSGERCSFDAAGNLFLEGDSRAYAPGGRVVRCQGSALRYDEEGRLIERVLPSELGSVRYEWTCGGRLRAVVTPAGERIEFVYDCFGRRLLKRNAAGKARFVWCGDELLHEVRGSGRDRHVRTYLFEPSSWAPVAQATAPLGQAPSGADWLHHVTDGVGTPLFLVGGDGQIVERLDRSTWGETRGESQSPFGWPGQYLDVETGLAYHRFRYYDPSLGRFLSPDPLGIEGGADLYGYPPDPLRWDDPLGLRFPDSVKQATLEESRMANGGDVKCSNPVCGVTCIQPQKSMKGDTLATRPSMIREWQLDHKLPVSKGGPDTRSNCQVLCRKCNREKWNS